jgi:hypothetical protein
MKPIAVLSLVLIIIAACVAIFFVGALKPTSIGAYLFLSIWLVIPYAGMAVALVIQQRSGSASLPWYAAMSIIAFGGLLFLADTIFWHPDAQGGIAVVMTPILQAIAMALLALVCWWMSRKPCRSSNKAD